MPTNFKLSNDLRPAGVCMRSAFPGDEVLIEFAGFHSSAEGEIFNRIVDSLTSQYLQLMKLEPYQVNHLLAVISPDQTATLYCNELNITATVQAKGPVQAGDPVTKASIADFVDIDIGLIIPPTHAFVYVFSQGWRRSIVFDFGPFQKDNPPRTFHIGRSLAAAFSNLLFNERFTLSEPEWDDLIARGWFLFIGLSDGTAGRMVEFLRTGVDLDRLMPEIELELSKVVEQAVDLASKNETFKSHATFIEKAYERFAASDSVSAAHLLFPRIEGLLRSYHKLANPNERPNQNSLLETAFPQIHATRFSTSLLRADQFSSFVNKVIFPGFDWQAPAGSTRHTIGHGIVTADDITSKSVVVAMLTVHHLLYTLLAPRTYESTNVIIP